MEKSNPNRTLLLFLIAVVVCLGLISFVLCIFAEFSKTEADEVQFDGRRCSLPRSEAFRFGIAGLICLSTLQILGNLMVCGLFFAAVKAGFGRKKSLATFSGVLLIISWMSFGVAAILIFTAASMNKRQPYGKGWLDGDCYVVKDGIFAGASVLVLITAGCILVTTGLILRPFNLIQNKWKLQTRQRN